MHTRHQKSLYLNGEYKTIVSSRATTNENNDGPEENLKSEIRQLLGKLEILRKTLIMYPKH